MATTPTEKTKVKTKTKRVTRKKAVVRNANKVTAKSTLKRSPRRTSTTKATSARRETQASIAEVRAPESLAGNNRRAPTALASKQAEKKWRKKQILIVAFMLLVGLGTSAMVGYLDPGRIDVQKTITDRNERIRTNSANAEDTAYSKIEVPVQNTNQQPDGGLVARSADNLPLKPQSVPVVATTTASSTNQTATPTNQMASSSPEVASSTALVPVDDIQNTTGDTELTPTTTPSTTTSTETL